MNSTPVETIYFGGGTPSLLEEKELAQVMDKLYGSFNISPRSELTLEANPDDIAPEKLAAWKSTGINRLSIGIQSFFDQDLQWMNRAHDARQARKCIIMAQDAGFNNLTIDLIYGTPTQSNEQWLENIQTAVGLNIPHLSCYALTVEPGTALNKMIELRRKEAVDPEKQAIQFLLLMNQLKGYGYEHYEISNFAKPGFRSRHNSSYWQGKSYLGLGPSAHSYNGHTRKWNIANNALYIQSIRQGTIPSEEEILSLQQQLNEFIMISLRTAEGLDLEILEKKFSPPQRLKLEKDVSKYIELGQVERINASLRLTDAGKLFADGISADLFVTGH